MELRNSPVDIISANNGILPPPYPGEGGVYTAAVYTRAEDIPDVFVVGDSTTTVAPDGTEHVNRRLSEDTMYGAFYYIRLQSDNGIAVRNILYFICCLSFFLLCNNQPCEHKKLLIFMSLLYMLTYKL